MSQILEQYLRTNLLRSPTNPSRTMPRRIQYIPILCQLQIQPSLNTPSDSSSEFQRQNPSAEVLREKYGAIHDQVEDHSPSQIKLKLRRSSQKGPRIRTRKLSLAISEEQHDHAPLSEVRFQMSKPLQSPRGCWRQQTSVSARTPTE